VKDSSLNRTSVSYTLDKTRIELMSLSCPGSMEVGSATSPTTSVFAVTASAGTVVLRSAHTTVPTKANAIDRLLMVRSPYRGIDVGPSVKPAHMARAVSSPSRVQGVP
jgi:hypothetical protein